MDRTRRVPVWLLLAISATFFITASLALRRNNQNMIALREAVFIADEQNGDVETALRELRQYVHSHMNTDLAVGDNAIRPPIQLKHRYDRLVEAELAKRSSSNNLYNDAQIYCEQQIQSFLGRDKLGCVRQYIDDNAVTNEATEINIPDDLYKFDFISPRWSPDLAGWSLVLGTISSFFLVVRLLVDKAIQRKLNH